MCGEVKRQRAGPSPLVARNRWVRQPFLPAYTIGYCIGHGCQEHIRRDFLCYSLKPLFFNYTVISASFGKPSEATKIENKRTLNCPGHEVNSYSWAFENCV